MRRRPEYKKGGKIPLDPRKGFKFVLVLHGDVVFTGKIFSIKIENETKDVKGVKTRTGLSNVKARVYTRPKRAVA